MILLINQSYWTLLFPCDNIAKYGRVFFQQFPGFHLCLSPRRNRTAFLAKRDSFRVSRCEAFGLDGGDKVRLAAATEHPITVTADSRMPQEHPIHVKPKDTNAAANAREILWEMEVKFDSTEILPTTVADGEKKRQGN